MSARTPDVWIEAARPRTLPAAIAPVVVGTATATEFIGWRFAAALIVSLAVQVAVNYANDYFDGVKGVDTEDRLGPRRVVAAGLISPRAMRWGIVAALSVAAIAGLVLAVMISWWLLAVGAAAFLAALGYSGGSRPYASMGLGELFVFVFFGLVATVGSAFVQDERIALLPVTAAVPVGLLAVAILVANNLRDLPTDDEAGKLTLAVRMGDHRTRWFYTAAVGLAFVMVFAVVEAAGSVWPMLALIAAAPAAKPVWMTLTGVTGRPLVGVLTGTAQTQLGFGLLLAAGLLIAGDPEGLVP